MRTCSALRRGLKLPTPTSHGFGLRKRLHTGRGDECVQRAASLDDKVAAATGPRPAAAAAKTARLHPLVERLNSTLEDFPRPSFVGFIGLSYAVFGSTFVVLNAVGFDFPALAVAGAVSRLMRWFKRPFDLVLAVGIAKAVPSSTSIRLGPLIILPMPREEPAADAASSKPAPPEQSLVSRWSQFATRWLEGPINEYGAPFMLARWVTGLSLVSATTSLVHTGADVSGLLGLVFSNPEAVMVVSGKASAVAGAMVANTVSLPLRVLAFAHFGRPTFVALGIEPVSQAVAAPPPAAAPPGGDSAPPSGSLRAPPESDSQASAPPR